MADFTGGVAGSSKNPPWFPLYWVLYTTTIVLITVRITRVCQSESSR